eukprot:4313034-Pyramimonas_sp.AAC.2
MDQSDTGSVGIFSQWTNRTQEARVCEHLLGEQRHHRLPCGPNMRVAPSAPPLHYGQRLHRHLQRLVPLAQLPENVTQIGQRRRRLRPRSGAPPGRSLQRRHLAPQQRRTLPRPALLCGEEPDWSIVRIYPHFLCSIGPS